MGAKLTQGSIFRHTMELSLPMMVGVLAIVGFNLVDTFFIGQLGKKELAAISYTFPVVMIIGSFAFGTALALTSLISRALGENDTARVRAYTTDGLSLALCMVAVLSALGLLSIRPLFRLLGAEGESLELIVGYMSIWYFNLIFLVIPMVGNGALRGTGDTRSPAVIMIIAGLVNMVLDPLLIFGWGPFPRMELQGAAWATVCSRFTTLLASLYLLHFREHLLISPFRSYRDTLANWKKILNIGIPAGINNAIVPISMALLTAWVSQFGDDVIAGFGVGTRIEAFVVIVLLGFSTGLTPFIGQNWGAGLYPRIRVAYAYGVWGSIIWIGLCCMVGYGFTESLVGLFNRDAMVMKAASDYVWLTMASLVFHTLLLHSNAFFNAIGASKSALLLTAVRMVLLYVPLAWVLKGYFGYLGIFAASPMANLVSGVLAWLSYRKRLAMAESEVRP